ncbi:triose-phosphate isomerase [Halovivax cerinus]|uniref:Triosephosphate isomerase n=1 Tax=Halovivax cerinus TaxID=1487865 RepID=A0ABD5NNV5_9EURY|nr:triose-phosphate isomerase [Halovivax cerinus]
MFVLVNTKTYPCDQVAVAEAAAAVEPTTDARLAVAPQPTAIDAVADTGVETWAQHVDPIEPGSNTGSILAESVADAGATGTLLNHSEHRIRLDQLDEGLSASDRADLETIVCANTPEQAAAAAALGPDAVAIEPPALIGTGTPVSQADPEIVESAVTAVDGVDESVAVLCGAGISTGQDVVAARELGAEGVLLASGVAKADDPAAALESLVDPL